MLEKNKSKKLEKIKNKKEEVVEDKPTENKFKEKNPSEKEKSLEKKETLEEDLEEAPEKSGKLSKADRQAYWFFGILIGFFVLVLLFYYFLQSLNYFSYQGLDFTKIKEGELIFYHAIVPIVKFPGEENVNYHFYFRTDPRENKIPVENKIEIVPDINIYISINETGLRQCEQAAISIDSISRYLREGGGFNVQAAVPDDKIASELNLSYMTCENNPTNSIVLLEKGESTKIKRIENTNCYVIDIANCEILPAVEKFEVQSYLDARSRKKI